MNLATPLLRWLTLLSPALCCLFAARGILRFNWKAISFRAISAPSSATAFTAACCRAHALRWPCWSCFISLICWPCATDPGGLP